MGDWGIANCAAHGLDQPLGDRGTQARAFIAARQPHVRLLERLEHARTHVHRHTDTAVLDIETQPHRVGTIAGEPRDPQPHMPVISELDRIAQ